MKSDPAVRMLSVVRTGIYAHLLPKGLLVRPAPFSVRCWNSTVLELASLRKADPCPKIYLLNSEFANLSKGCNGKKNSKSVHISYSWIMIVRQDIFERPVTLRAES